MTTTLTEEAMIPVTPIERSVHHGLVIPNILIIKINLILTKERRVRHVTVK